MMNVNSCKALTLFTAWAAIFYYKAQKAPKSNSSEFRADGAACIPSLNDADSAHNDALKLYHALANCNDSYIRDKVHSALNILDQALRTYGPKQLFSSYNGGKDAEVIMHLLRAAAAKFSVDNKIPVRPKFVYFVIDEFPEVLEHIQQTQTRLKLDLTAYDGGIMQGLEQHVKHMATEGLTSPAFVIGTRHGDPNSAGQTAFCPSSNWTPVAFMRVNPILDWDYGHIWHFLRLFQLPYCSLYDQGYTSLGNRKDTHANPVMRKALAATAADGEVPGSNGPGGGSGAHSGFWPAYLLDDWTLEREGRKSAAPKVSDAAASTPSGQRQPRPADLLQYNGGRRKSLVVKLRLSAAADILREVKESGSSSSSAAAAFEGVSVGVVPFAACPDDESVITVASLTDPAAAESLAEGSNSSSSSNVLHICAALERIVRRLPEGSILRSC